MKTKNKKVLSYDELLKQVIDEASVYFTDQEDEETTKELLLSMHVKTIENEELKHENNQKSN